MTSLRNYLLVTAAYWGFTLTDGALRMLVLLQFHEMGYSPLQLAFLFLLYELMGVVTNVTGGWVGSRIGLRGTLLAGLALQIGALAALSALDPTWPAALAVSYVMGTQAISGIAKDLTKMSSKSAIKLVVPADAPSLLFRWVAVLTGSKNALKGVGFFLGGALLTWVGFGPALLGMAGGLVLVIVGSAALLPSEMGRMKEQVSFRKSLSKSPPINALSTARFFLFGSRDVWFVVALPVFLSEALGWGFVEVGGFMAAWVIGYGVVQAGAPRLLRRSGGAPDGRTARHWVYALAVLPGAIAAALALGAPATWAVVGGLALFGIVFAVNSAVHSYLILAYAQRDAVALDVGFYYTANALGRLVGTLLSGLLFQVGHLPMCLWASSALLVAAGIASRGLPTPDRPARVGASG